MGLFIICLMKEKLFGTKDLGPTSTPCLFFWKLYRTKLNTKQTTIQLKQVIQKILKHVMKKMLRTMNINKHKLSKNITNHCKKWGTALHSHHSPDLGGLIVMGGPKNLDGLWMVPWGTPRNLELRGFLVTGSLWESLAWKTHGGQLSRWSFFWGSCWVFFKMCFEAKRQILDEKEQMDAEALCWDLLQFWGTGKGLDLRLQMTSCMERTRVGSWRVMNYVNELHWRWRHSSRLTQTACWHHGNFWHSGNLKVKWSRYVQMGYIIVVRYTDGTGAYPQSRGGLCPV